MAWHALGWEIPLLNVERLCPETTPESASDPMWAKQVYTPESLKLCANPVLDKKLSIEL
jgi:hypothetical protein